MGRCASAAGRFVVPPDFLEAAAQTGRLLVRRGRSRGRSNRRIRSRASRPLDRPGKPHRRASFSSVGFSLRLSVKSTRLLLLSRSPRSPAGLGATSGALGRYLMDHIRLVANGKGPPLPPGPPPEQGRCLYLPRFDARDLSMPGQSRGFGVQVSEVFADAGASDFLPLPTAKCFRGRKIR